MIRSKLADTELDWNIQKVQYQLTNLMSDVDLAGSYASKKWSTADVTYKKNDLLTSDSSDKMISKKQDQVILPVATKQQFVNDPPKLNSCIISKTNGLIQATNYNNRKIDLTDNTNRFEKCFNSDPLRVKRTDLADRVSVKSKENGLVEKCLIYYDHLTHLAKERLCLEKGAAQDDMEYAHLFKNINYTPEFPFNSKDKLYFNQLVNSSFVEYEKILFIDNILESFCLKFDIVLNRNYANFNKWLTNLKQFKKISTTATDDDTLIDELDKLIHCISSVRTNLWILSCAIKKFQANNKPKKRFIFSEENVNKFLLNKY